MPKKIKNSLLLGFLLLGLNLNTFSQVTVDAPCMIGTLTCELNNNMSPDGTGRNVYTNDSAQVHIKYNPGISKWEIISYGPEAFVYYASEVNSFAPNPPNSTEKTYPNEIIGEGCLDEGLAIVMGPGTQGEEGQDPCIPFGGDADGDGICNFFDKCPGSDDNIDTDGDGIPDGCDSDPGMANGTVIVTTLCLDPNPIEFLPDGKDGSGRNIFSNAFTQLEIRFNIGLDRWEIKAQSPGTDVFFINDFASWPNPPDDVTNPWMSVNMVCDTTPATVEGEGTQDMLVIPTLTQWGIIILGLLMMIFGFVYIHEKNRSQTLYIN